MARHFEKLIADIDKVLTAEFKYDQDDDEAEPRLDLDFIDGLVSKYHDELRKNLKAITNTVKGQKHDELSYAPNASEKDKVKAKLEFYETYQKKLIKELVRQYPELEGIINTSKPSESSFSIKAISGAECPKVKESYFSGKVINGLRIRAQNHQSIEKAINERFGRETVSIVSAHMDSVGFKDAYKTGKFEAIQKKEVDARMAEERREREDEGEKYDSALTKMAGGNPGNWVITSGMFSGKTLAEVGSMMEGGDEEGRRLNNKLLSNLEDKKNAIEASETILQNEEKAIIAQAKNLTGRTYTYAQLSGMYNTLPPVMQTLIDKQEKRIKHIAILSTRYQSASIRLNADSKRIRGIGDKATNWILNTYATIVANPNAFARRFGKALPANKTGLNNALVAMFKSYAKSSDLIKKAYQAKGVLAEEERREESNFFYTLTEFYIGRDGVKRSRPVTRYNAPKKMEGEGFTSEDTSKEPKNLSEQDKPGRNASGRVYKKDGTKVSDEEVRKKRKEKDYGLDNMLRGLGEGMSVHDRVKLNKLQDVLKNLPKRTTKEWVIDPLTGEQRLMRKGSNLGLMLVYDKHRKLVWKEFDVYGKARKAVGGSLERLKQKEIDKQRILLFAAESMIADSIGKDRTVKEADAVNLGQVDNDRKVITDEVMDKNVQYDGSEAGDYSSQFTKKRQKYSEKIKEATSYKQLEKTEMKIYEDMGKAGHIVDPSIRKQIIIVGQIENFMEGSSDTPNFYTGPMVNRETILAMREYGSPASLKAIEQFHEAQLKHYSEGGRGMAESNYFHESENRYSTEYELLDSQLPIKTQLDLKRMELRNSGVKD